MPREVTYCFLDAICLPSGDWATWVGSVGVVLTLCLTLLLIARDRRTRRLDDIARRDEVLRIQAERVAGWLESRDFAPGTRSVVLSNTSETVMYEVYVFVVSAESAISLPQKLSQEARSGAVVVALLPPGRWRIGVLTTHLQGTRAPKSVELAFTDQAGRFWLRRAKGELVPMLQDPRKFFDIEWSPVYVTADAVSELGAS